MPHYGLHIGRYCWVFFTFCSSKNLIQVWFYTGIPPTKYHYVDDLVVILPQNVWEYLYNRWVMHSNAHFWPLGSPQDIYHLSGTWIIFEVLICWSQQNLSPTLNSQDVYGVLSVRGIWCHVWRTTPAVQCKHCRVMCLRFSLAILWTFLHAFHRFGEAQPWTTYMCVPSAK